MAGFNAEDSGIIARMAEHAKNAKDAKDKNPVDKYGRTPLAYIYNLLKHKTMKLLPR
jgi:hypothetical protein